jgi:DNA-binding NarL/FixJ family response regulator
VIRVAVVASAAAVRAGLHALLNEDEQMEVITEAASLRELRMRLAGIDVLVWVLPTLTRDQLTEILNADEAFAVLFLVEPGDVEIELPERFALHTWGVLALEASAEELHAAVHALEAGLLVGLPELLEPLLGELPESKRLPADELVETLSEREVEVLQLLSEGLANKQIALKLGISEHTVKFHSSAIYAKLGATNRTEAVRLGILRGLVVL